jgi:hypothetical protein
MSFTHMVTNYLEEYYDMSKEPIQRLFNMCYNKDLETVDSSQALCNHEAASLYLSIADSKELDGHL